MFIISVIHVFSLLFLMSLAVQSLPGRNFLFHALLLRVCLYIVVLVYNPLLLPLFLLNFLVLGFEESSLSKNATLDPPFIQVLLSVCYRAHLLHRRSMYGHHCHTILRLLREPHHVPLTNTCSICDIRLWNIVLWRC